MSVSSGLSWTKGRTEKWGQKYLRRARQARIFLSTFFCPLRPRRQIVHSGDWWFSVIGCGRRPRWVFRVFRGSSISRPGRRPGRLIRGIATPSVGIYPSRGRAAIRRCGERGTKTISPAPNSERARFQVLQLDWTTQSDQTAREVPGQSQRAPLQPDRSQVALWPVALGRPASPAWAAWPASRCVKPSPSHPGAPV